MGGLLLDGYAYCMLGVQALTMDIIVWAMCASVLVFTTSAMFHLRQALTKNLKAAACHLPSHIPTFSILQMVDFIQTLVQSFSIYKRLEYMLAGPQLIQRAYDKVSLTTSKLLRFSRLTEMEDRQPGAPS